MSNRFLIRGVLSNSQELLSPSDSGLHLKQTARLQVGNISRANVELIHHPVKPDDVIAICFNNGFKLWISGDDLKDHAKLMVSRDGEAVWEITQPENPEQTRGIPGLVIEALDFFDVIDLKEESALSLSIWWENKLLPNKTPGLYRFDLNAESVEKSVRVKPPVNPNANQPLLLFIHGTGSCTTNGFGGLWKTQRGLSVLKELADNYGENIYCYDHRTLSESPIQNTLELVNHLPQGAELDLVTHSRGGLIGELLGLGELTPAAVQPDLNLIFNVERVMSLGELFHLKLLDQDELKGAKEAYQQDRQRLIELIELLAKKDIKVRRFVRVACPAKGTTLASGRLDRWLSVLSFLSGFTPLDDGIDLIAGIVKKRTDPRTLPGIEAMMPGSALIQYLNYPKLEVKSDLTVIAGDIKGDSIWGRIKTIAADWFFSGEHDLVVNTASMLGGMPRSAEVKACYFRDQGADVNHSNYFKNEKTLELMLAGLLKNKPAFFNFKPLSKAVEEQPKWQEAIARSRSGSPRPIVVVLPGILGSELEVNNQKVWLNYASLAFGGLKKLSYDNRSVTAVDILGDYYGPLLEFLSASHQVEVFAYDWRLSIFDSATNLSNTLNKLLMKCESTKQPLRLVAHSMGGLVVRAMLSKHPDIWQRMQSLTGSRVLMLGTPNHGSHETIRWLTGRNATQAKLTLLDLTQDKNEIIALVRQFPGLLELLPSLGDQDYFQAKFWQELKNTLKEKWSPAEQAALSKARETWQKLDETQIDSERVLYVAGVQPETVAKCELSGQTLRILATPLGDGTVTWESGKLEGLKMWYASGIAHGDMCKKKRVFAAYLDLLETGKTTRLEDKPPYRAPRAAGQKTDLFPISDRPPLDSLPSEADLSDLTFGEPSRDSVDDQDSPSSVLKVSIQHGDLAYSRHPVLVGHYQGDTIVSAEAALDKQLKRALSRRLQLDRYPGPLGTQAVFIHPDARYKPGGAIVIGLGQVGELTPGTLENSVRQALLEYALEIINWPDEQRFGPAKTVRSGKLSCLLIGTGAGEISVRDSLEAILSGAIAANLDLLKTELHKQVSIDEIEFVELLEDVALQATQALSQLLNGSSLSIHWPDQVLRKGQGGRRRVKFDETANWWNRLDIAHEERLNELRYVALTDRARAEVSMVSGQLSQADAFVARACKTTNSDGELSRTLFEMLIPNRLKQFAPDQRDLVILVDEVSARFPWELLEDRWSNNGQPLAIAAGMVRQLRAYTFRAQPAHADQSTALVIGNPTPLPANFADLPGAAREAEKVSLLLKDSQYDVDSLIATSGVEIMRGLHSKKWRILHLAGHGVYDHLVIDNLVISEDRGQTEQTRQLQQRRVSGMVIGDDWYLTPGDIEQMRWVPELVFINCCYLGRTLADNTDQPKYNRLAANLAVQFIRMGVKAVVAAGWAVDDNAAECFAEEFYTRMLDGDTFGYAVQEARKKTWRQFPTVNTWGAYQCYGDPDFSLRIQAKIIRRRNVSKKLFHSPTELIVELENAVSTQSTISEYSVSKLRNLQESAQQLVENRLMQIPEALKEKWRKRADVNEALGFYYATNRLFELAIKHFDTALAGQEGTCSLQSIEKSANCRVRLAGELWNRSMALGAEVNIQDCERLIKRAITDLEILRKRGKTVERLNLLGSAHKRQVLIGADKESKIESLKNMKGFYYDAYELAKKNNSYSYTNWRTAEIVQSWLEPSFILNQNWMRTLKEECQLAKNNAELNDLQDPAFWNQVMSVDCDLLIFIAEKSQSIENQTIIAGYQNAFARGAKLSDFASIQEHLGFLTGVAKFAAQTYKDNTLSQLCEALTEIENELFGR